MLTEEEIEEQQYWKKQFETKWNDLVKREGKYNLARFDCVKEKFSKEYGFGTTEYYKHFALLLEPFPKDFNIMETLENTLQELKSGKKVKNMKQEKELVFGLCEDAKIEGVDKYLIPKDFFEEYNEFSFEKIHFQIIKSLRNCECNVTDSITVYVNGPISVLIGLIRICISNVMSLKVKYYNSKTGEYDMYQYVNTDMWKPELEDGGYL